MNRTVFQFVEAKSPESELSEPEKFVQQGCTQLKKNKRKSVGQDTNLLKTCLSDRCLRLREDDVVIGGVMGLF